MTDANLPAEHRVGDAFVIVDLNELNNPGHGIRELIFRVRRAGVVSVYRCHLATGSLPTAGPYDTASYLLTQATRRSLLFAYREARAAGDGR